MTQQQALDLRVAPRFGRADFLISDSNRDALDWVERWPEWPARALVLYGPRGSGKTHLAHLWCARNDAALIDGETLREPQEAPALIAVDNADLAAERPLLHLYNLCLERGGGVLLTMATPPSALPMALPDLASRLRALPAAGIAAPDDELLAAVLVKHFNDQGIGVAPDVVAYLVPRIERSLAAVAALAAALDRRALAAGRRVTVRLAREVLAEVSLA
jgi:chromosomal replication initiation ATPase DnaA